MKAVKARKDTIVAASVKGVTSWVTSMPGLTVFWGQARFTGPHSVTVNDQELTAEKIFINVGGRPVVPDWPALQEICLPDLGVGRSWRVKQQVGLLLTAAH